MTPLQGVMPKCKLRANRVQTMSAKDYHCGKNI
jgi:hypothetical protein